MSEINFGVTADLLKNAVDGASTSHSVIANNIANVNTPLYHRADVSFKDSLAASLGSEADPNQLELTATSDKHFAIGGAESPQPFEVTTLKDDLTVQRLDGNNVDVDAEMAKLAINSGYAQTMNQLLTNQYTRMRQAITERI